MIDVLEAVTNRFRLIGDRIMKTRVISGLVMLPLLGIVFLGDMWLAAVCFIISIMGVREFYNCFRKGGINPSLGIAVGSAVLLYAMYFWVMFGSGGDKYSGIGEIIMPWFFLSVVASLLYLFKFDDRKLDDALVTMAGIFYVIFFVIHVSLTAQIEKYGILVWLIFITAFGTDIMAYFSGYFFGKRKFVRIKV